VIKDSLSIFHPDWDYSHSQVNDVSPNWQYPDLNVGSRSFWQGLYKDLSKTEVFRYDSSLFKEEAP